MSVQITQTRRSVRTIVTYSVSGAEPMAADRSVRQFVPDTVTLEHAGTYFHYSVSGDALKKDGTTSLNRVRHRSLYAIALAVEPEWLQNLVRDYCANAGIKEPR